VANDKQVIEVGGVKLEVDMRYARRIETLTVGAPVRVLVKSYGENYNVHSGVVIGFEPFAKLPTIIVAYMEVEYGGAKVKFLHLNANSKDTEVVAADSDAVVAFDGAKAIEAIDRSIEKARGELNNLIAQKAYFIENIGKAWTQVETTPAS
jgi:hypothetical protein